MHLATVVGTVVSTSKDERLVGFKLLLTQRVDAAGNPVGNPEVAVDTVGAGTGGDRHRHQGQLGPVRG